MSKRTDRIYITAEQAISALSNDESIHTFRNPRGMLIGADWSREELVKALQEAGPESIEIGGESCMKMDHGLILHSGGPLFIESNTDRLRQLEKEL